MYRLHGTVANIWSTCPSRPTRRGHTHLSSWKPLIMGTHPTVQDGPAALVRRLERATNAHDLDALVACFAPAYRNETPAHPERSFTGRAQVSRNWEQIFSGIPDLTATVLRSAVHDGEVWSEWEHRGTRRDGSAHLMRGVVI